MTTLIKVAAMAIITSNTANADTWVQVAQSAELLAPNQVESTVERFKMLPESEISLIEDILTQMANVELGTQGIIKAADILSEGLVRVDDPELRMPGDTRATSALKMGGALVLRGLLIRSGPVIQTTEDPASEAFLVLQTLRTLPLSTSDIAKLESEARLGLGPELFLPAVMKIKQGGTKGP